MESLVLIKLSNGPNYYISSVKVTMACRFRKILNNANRILNLDKDETILWRYYNAFTAYNDLMVNLITSSKVIISNNNIRKLLIKVVENYLPINITVTLEVHVIFNHIEDMVARSYGLGLGFILPRQ